MMSMFERKQRETMASLQTLKCGKAFLGEIMRSLSVKLEGKTYVVTSTEEAYEILDAYADWHV